VLHFSNDLVHRRERIGLLNDGLAIDRDRELSVIPIDDLGVYSFLLQGGHQTGGVCTGTPSYRALADQDFHGLPPLVGRGGRCASRFNKRQQTCQLPAISSGAVVRTISPATNQSSSKGTEGLLVFVIVLPHRHAHDGQNDTAHARQQFHSWIKGFACFPVSL
jgi:hypothetical protein